MSSSPITFVDACLAGDAFEHDVDQWVAQWHDAAPTSSVASITLDDFLGMTDQEYALWVEQPSALRFILAARWRGRDVNDLLTSPDEYALAARAESPSDARKVLQWLVETGRVDPGQAAQS